MNNIIEIDDLETAIAPAGASGSVVIEIILIIIYL